MIRDISERARLVGALSDGGFVVAWQSQNLDGDGWGIYAKRFDASGAPITSSEHPDGERSQANPAKQSSG